MRKCAKELYVYAVKVSIQTHKKFYLNCQLKDGLSLSRSCCGLLVILVLEVLNGSIIEKVTQITTNSSFFQ